MAEQISTASEQRFLEDVFRAALAKGGCSDLLLVGQGLAEPGHGTIDLVQLDFFRTGNLVFLLPDLQARPITAWVEQPMKHRQEQDPFHGQIKPSPSQQPLDDLGKLQFVPQPAEDESRSDPAVRNRRRAALPMRGEHQGCFGELRSRLEQAFELAVLLEFVQPSHGGDDALLTASVEPLVLDDLKIHPVAGAFLAEEHGGIPAGLTVATMILANMSAYCQAIWTTRGTRNCRRQCAGHQKHRRFGARPHSGSRLTVEDGPGVEPRGASGEPPVVVAGGSLRSTPGTPTLAWLAPWAWAALGGRTKAQPTRSGSGTATR